MTCKEFRRKVAAYQFSSADFWSVAFNLCEFRGTFTVNGVRHAVGYCHGSWDEVYAAMMRGKLPPKCVSTVLRFDGTADVAVVMPKRNPFYPE